MKKIVDVSLVANIKIDEPAKLEIFKVTSRDAAEIFAEAHFKIRGALASAAVEFVRTLRFDHLSFYQGLPDDDWVVATQKIVEGLKTRSLFLYFEDHRIVAAAGMFCAMVKEFETLKLDYLVYSFHRASRLSSINLLPFSTTETPNLTAFTVGLEQLALLGRISPSYYTYSLVSLVSVEYFKNLLSAENKRLKLYSRKGLALLSLLFPYPNYRKVYHRLNQILARVNLRCCIYDYSSPFNLEKMWWESVMINGRLAIGIPKHEVFANYDDDNGAPDESLIKRGLFPFCEIPDIVPSPGSAPFVEKTIDLAQNERRALRYHSAVGRIRRAPIVVVEVKSGRISLQWPGDNIVMVGGDVKALYANKGGEIVALEPASIVLRIYDECF